MPANFDLDCTFNNTYVNNLADLGSIQSPNQFPDAKWLITSPELCETIQIKDSQAWLKVFSGQNLLSGIQPIAQKYTGHQFGHYNPDLGDGRGILLGELETANGRWDLHVKGAGKTPYSRFGDGKAVLRSCVREFLASEALYYLGIPTSRALGVFTTGETVQRETAELGAALVRTCHSHLRFGHFEYAFYQQQHTLLQRLIDYSVQYVLQLDMQNASLEEKTQVLFDTVIQRTAEMIAKWQAFGFCHGVMNTDNMSILGITFDYGPFGFLDDYKPSHICNHSDHSGRYAYDEQPGVALWNLNALGHALSPFLSEQKIRDSLQKYEPILLEKYANLARNKLGLSVVRDDDRKLLGELLAIMQKDKRDYTYTWRLLSELDVHNEPQNWADHFLSRDAAMTWLNKYKHRQEVEKLPQKQRKEQMLAVNPKYILRNHLAQQAIEQAEHGDTSFLNELFTILKEPFQTQKGKEDFSKLPPDWSKSLSITCSS